MPNCSSRRHSHVIINHYLPMEEEVPILSSVSELRTVNKTHFAAIQKNHKHNTVIASNDMAY